MRNFELKYRQLRGPVGVRKTHGLTNSLFCSRQPHQKVCHARLGIYSSAIEKDVSPARLKRFFVKRDSSYQIHQNVRNICTFARQNVCADPPFSRIDLISCRNVLIYLSSDLHKRCIPQFHYALKPGGYLILGPAESIGIYDELFKLVDRKNKIYAKLAGATPRTANFIPQRGLELAHLAGRSTTAGATFGSELLKMADRIMLKRGKS